MISAANSIPAIGALNVAAIPAAAPQARNTRFHSTGSLIHCASEEPTEEPICTTGPSRPTDAPHPMDNAVKRVLNSAVV